MRIRIWCHNQVIAEYEVESWVDSVNIDPYYEVAYTETLGDREQIEPVVG